MTVSIVIPAKNEGASISKVLDGVKTALEGVELEIIVVDDGSLDSTFDLALRSGVHVIKHPYSKGNGASIKTGTRAAKGDVIVFMDADGQHNPTDIPRLLKKLEEGFDLVVGARQRGSQANFGRGIANGFYNWLASYISGHDVKDLTSGFRVVRANKFKEFIYLLPNGFSYPTTSTMAFFRAGYSVAYEPIHAARREGKSHIKPIRDGARFLLIIFKIGTLYSPLKVFAPIGAIIFLMATLWYGYTLKFEGRFTNMSALLYTGSVMIFLMGLISEQITALMYKKDGE
ncbi:MAG: glycosyl transferase [Sphingopyxis sp.]|nr:MAG: glycosyl transferase [Sphingopyxis sp.]